MKILLTGSTGLVGGGLLENSKHSFHLLLREKINTPHSFTLWEDLNPQSLPSEDFGILHLAGESVAPLFWTKSLKKRIHSSRTKTTKKLFEVIRDSGRKPQFFIQASSVGIYGDRGDKEILEDEEIKKGGLFLQEVCLDLEKEARKFEELCPTAILRLGMVLSWKKGFLPFQASFFKKGIYPIPLGRMWLPFISLEDLTSLILWIIENKKKGIYNAVSPNPITLKEFYKELNSHLKGFRVPMPFPLFFMKRFTLESFKNLLLSIKASSLKLEKEGFVFKKKSLKEIFNSNSKA